MQALVDSPFKVGYISTARRSSRLVPGAEKAIRKPAGVDEGLLGTDTEALGSLPDVR